MKTTKTMDNLENIAHETIKRVRDRLFRKIPDLRDCSDVIFLSSVHFRNLIDEEFILLLMLPDIEVRVGRKTGEYVNERRRLLGLRQNDQNRIEQEK